MASGPSVASAVNADRGRCPVCRARFRDSATCSRCGTDLSMLMRLAARAHIARERCRLALEQGDLADALRCAREAEALQRSRE